MAERFAQIVATGRYVPERVITNAELDRLLGAPVDKWLVENVGICQRHVMADHEATSDLATAAARQALERAAVDPLDIDLLIVATDTPDYISPATASAVQSKLGARNAGVFDVNCACAAFVTGLDIAGKYIAGDAAYRHILVVGAYGMTRYVDWSDKYTCTLFADGAGAVLLRAGGRPGFLGARLIADGRFHDYLGIYSGGTARPATPETVASLGKPRVEFAKRFPADTNVHWIKLVHDLMAKIGHQVSDIDLIIFTQLNLRTIEQVMSQLGLPLQRTHWIMDKWGYTGSACMAMALDDALQGGLVERGLQPAPQPGDLVAFCGSGGGWAMAAAAFRWV